MKLSINAAFQDKAPSTRRAFGEGWVALNLNAEQLAEYINDGYAFSAEFRDNRRRTTHFIAADFVAADFDGGVSLEEARSNPLVKEHATIIYTTPSHRKDGHDRFRIVFRTPYSIEDAAVWRAALIGLAKHLNADMSATDGARLFFGSRGSNPEILDHELSEGALARLIEQGHEYRRKAKAGAGNSIAGANLAAVRRIGREQFVFAADKSQHLLADLTVSTRVHCPFHDDKKPSAFVLRSTKGSPGIYCSSCMQTFWLEGRKRTSYNYYAFEESTARLAQDPVTEPPESEEDWPLGPDRSLLSPASAQIVEAKHLPPITRAHGVVLVRSPKGSGKTRQIELIVKRARNGGRSVLLIGHRRTLLQELSARLNLKCYLDDEVRHFTTLKSGKAALKAKTEYSNARPDYYAVSIDSLEKRLPHPRWYDTVIIDECEQVLSHICAKTIEQPEPILKVLQHYVSRAPSLFMFDADLNNITTGFVSRCRAGRIPRPGDPSDSLHQIVNLHKETGRTCQVFESADDLRVDLLQAVANGKRVYVACNSKKNAAGIAKWLRDSVPDLRALLVTADDKDDPEVIDFLRDVRTQFLKYDALIASPAIGTGIDITFPNDEMKVDVVYGFFTGQINTHYDVDQQIGRVRNPGAVKVWISEEEEFFETDAEAIKLELVLTGKANVAIQSYGDDGIPAYNHDDPLLSLKADAYAAIRASQNRLKYYFIEHKQHGGWLVDHIEDSDGDHTNAAHDAAILDVAKTRAGRLLAAAKIDRAQYDEFIEARERSQPIGTQARYEVGRYELETFYGTCITEDMIATDDDGHFRQAVVRYESLNRSPAWMVEEALACYWSGSRWDEAFDNQTAWLLDALFISSTLLGKEGFDPDREISQHELEPFVALCTDRRRSLEMEYGVRLRRDFRRKPMRGLNDLLRLVGLSLTQARFEKRGGKRTYFYTLDGIRFAAMRRIVEARKRANMTAVDKANEYYRTRTRPVFPRTKPKAAPRDGEGLTDPDWFL